MTEPRALSAAPLGRALSLLLAAPLALLLLIHPGAFVNDAGAYSHGLLMLTMLGISGGFVHGVGFVPRALPWRLLFSPWCAWPLLVLGYALLARAQGF